MTRINIERSHRLGRAKARERAEGLRQRLTRELGLACHWQGDVLAVRHAGAEGQVEVGEDRVTVAIRLGLMLGMLAGSIERQVAAALDAALAD